MRSPSAGSVSWDNECRTEDRDSDTGYVTDTYRARQATIAIHVAANKARGNIPVAWPHDGMQHDRSAGVPLAQMYRQQGVNMIAERAQFADDRGNSVEASCADLLDRMQTGRFKVFRHLGDWFEEFRTYHRKDGRIVEEHDDLISATRYGAMCLRFARTPSQYGGRGVRRRPMIADGVETNR